MTLVCFGVTDQSAEVEKLNKKLKTLFPDKENEDYFSEIMLRKNERVKIESLSALILLGELCKRLGANTASLALKRTENGKPYFKDSHLHFSLSHSNGYIVAALSEDGAVGVDIECTALTAVKAQKLAERFFAADEISKFDGSAESFTRIWTKKEAQVKLLGATLSEAVAEDMSGIGTRGDAFCKHFDVDGNPVTLCLEKDTGSIGFFREDIGKLLAQ